MSGHQGHFQGPLKDIHIGASGSAKAAMIEFAISAVETDRTQTDTELIVTGEGATKGDRVEINIMYIPGAPTRISRITQAKDDGTFEFRGSWPLSQGTAEDGEANVYVYARDATKGDFDMRSLKASPWIVT